MPEHERASVQRPDAQIVRGLRLACETVHVAPITAVNVDDTVDLGVLGQAIQPFDLFLGEPRDMLLQVSEDLGTIEWRLTHPPLAVAADVHRRFVDLAQGGQRLSLERAEADEIAAEEERRGPLRPGI